jgi:phosphoglycolate phosphatase
VLTNKPLAATREMLDGLDLARFFGARVLGGDGPLPRKPDPAGLQAVMAQVSIAADATLMVGDSIVDLRTAHGANVRACLARYGFGCTAAASDALSPADVVIDAPVELLSHM